MEFVNSAEKRLDDKRKKFIKKLDKVKLLKWLPVVFFMTQFSFIVGLILSVLWCLFFTVFFDWRDLFIFKPGINIWFGVPGSGKTTMAAMISKYLTKGNYKVLSNVDIKGAYRLDPDSDLGTYDTSFGGDGAEVIIDEALMHLDNRDYMNFSKSNKNAYFALIRHYTNRADIFSQGYDVDKRVRDRAGDSNLFHLVKSPLKGFVVVKRIKKVLFIKKEDKSMVDGFEYKGLPRFIYCRSVWDSFDTLDMSLCAKAQKQWVKW